MWPKFSDKSLTSFDMHTVLIYRAITMQAFKILRMNNQSITFLFMHVYEHIKLPRELFPSYSFIDFKC